MGKGKVGLGWEGSGRVGIVQLGLEMVCLSLL